MILHLPGKPADGTLTLYDAASRVTSTERHANVVIVINNPTTNPSSSLTSNGSLLSKTTTVYDAAGRITQTTDAVEHTTSYQYDADGHRIEIDDSAAGIARRVKSTYDTVGRLASSTDAQGNTTYYLYDAAGNLIKTSYPDGTTRTTKYDANGRKIASIDQNGLETDYQYDAYGNLTSVILPAVTNPANGQIVHPTYVYAYDAYGNLTSVTDPLNHKTTYQYDALGNKVGETLPMNQTKSWAFNSLDQLASSTDFDGQKIAYTYDTVGRVTQKQEYAQGATSPTTTVIYTYDNPDANNDGGYTDTVTTPGGTTTNFYDVNGNLVKITSPQGTINYTYDPATGRETAVTTSNTDIRYAYDDLGRMTTVTVDKLDGVSLSASLVTTYSYDLNNNLIGTSLPNGTSETRQYDSLNRLIFLKNTGPANAMISSYIYTLDPNGNRRVVVENTGRRDDYTYDADGRLTQEAITNDPSAGSRTLTYAYDLAGNRAASTDTGAATGQQSLTYTYDANDRLTNVTGTSGYSLTYTYDNNGNTLTVAGSQQATYTWNLENHLVGANVTTSGVTHSVSDQYDDAGNRLSETVDGQTTTYLNDPNQAYDQVLEEYAPSGALAATYLRGLDLLFQDRSGVRSYYAKDDLGDTRALTNVGGAITDTNTYDAYGNLIGHTGTTPNEFLYAGQQFDTATQQYYQRARYYVPGAGSFSSRDTYEGNIQNPVTLQCYAYAGNDPVDNFDPSGHDLVSFIAGLALDGYLRALDAAPAATTYAFAVTRVAFYSFIGSTIYGALEEDGWVPSLGITREIQTASASIFVLASEIGGFFASLPGGQVPYGGTNLSRQVQAVRLQRGIGVNDGAKGASTRNGAAFEFRDDDGSYRTIVMFSTRTQKGGGHSERMIRRAMQELGIDFSRVTRIYSELQPCDLPVEAAGCRAMIAKDFPQAQLTYSFEYGDVPSRQRGKQQLISAVENLFDPSGL